MNNQQPPVLYNDVLTAFAVACMLGIVVRGMSSFINSEESRRFLQVSEPPELMPTNNSDMTYMQTKIRRAMIATEMRTGHSTSYRVTIPYGFMFSLKLPLAFSAVIEGGSIILTPIHDENVIQKIGRPKSLGGTTIEERMLVESSIWPLSKPRIVTIVTSGRAAHRNIILVPQLFTREFNYPVAYIVELDTGDMLLTLTPLYSRM